MLETTKTIPASALLSKPIIEHDEKIEHYAKLYIRSAKLKSRMTFGEFMTMPDEYIASMQKWPLVVWDISFTDYGVHQKLWINDTAEGTTIHQCIIRQREPQTVVDELYITAELHGFPDEAIVPPCESYNSTAARAWARLTNVAHTTATTDRPKPQVMGSFDREAAA